MISAKVIARSKSSVTGKEIVTFEIIYPRFILAELNTHRILSKNSASSRAIPVEKVIEAVRNNPAMPVHWGKNQPGMSAREELQGLDKSAVQTLWKLAANQAAKFAEEMSFHGAHKQVANRIIEPFQWMKTVITGTEWDNFFHLRRHPDADPNINALAEVMWQALQEAPEAFVLHPGEYHVPYVATMRDVDGTLLYGTKVVSEGNHKLTTFYPFEGGYKDALQVSSSCCAQTSFRTSDDSLDKAKRIYERLVESKPVHASPFEHQATPMEDYTYYSSSLEEDDGVNLQHPCTWQEGITAVDRHGQFWSGNFCGFIQHRQLIPDNACWDYKEHQNG